MRAQEPRSSLGALTPETLLPLIVGLALIVALVVNQYRSRRPLLTIRTMLTSTIPVAGIVLALSAAAACLKGFYLHQASAGINAGLGEKLDRTRLPTRPRCWRSAASGHSARQWRPRRRV